LLGGDVADRRSQTEEIDEISGLFAWRENLDGLLFGQEVAGFLVLNAEIFGSHKDDMVFGVRDV